MIRSIVEIDNMEGLDFEKSCAELLSLNDFSSIQVTQGSGDYGIDVIACKDGIKYAIQCKRYEKAVGVKAVQEALSGSEYYKCDRPVVLTNSHFTAQAKELAARTGVELWDRDRLEDLIRIAQPRDEAMRYELRENLRRSAEAESRRERLHYNNITTVLLIITFPFGLIPLWASKWPLLNKLLITAFLGIFFIAIFTIPRAAFAFCIIYWVVVLISARNVNNTLKNSR